MREAGPVRFALVERRSQREPSSSSNADLEVVFATGERLQIQPSGRGGAPHSIGRLAGMIHLPGSVRVYLCLTPCDMRKSFDGLHALVREHSGVGRFAGGHLFVFASRRRIERGFRIPIGLRGCRVPLASPIRQEAAPASTNSAWRCRSSSRGNERDYVPRAASVDGGRLNVSEEWNSVRLKFPLPRSMIYVR